MNRSNLIITCALLCAMLILFGVTAGLKSARAQLSPASPSAAAPATTQGSVATTGVADTQPFSRDSLPLHVATNVTWGRTPLMTRPYMVLLTRSMFVRGHIAEQSHIYTGAPPTRTNTEPSVIRAETGVVFNGVTITNSTVDALVEDTTTGRVLTVHSGDAVARGRVGKITMESLEYLHGGKVTLILIGQNFAGSSGDISSSPATSEPAGTSGASGVSPQDMLEKLRQKRQQELGN